MISRNVHSWERFRNDLRLHFSREPFWTVPERQPQPFRSGTVPLGTVAFTLMLGTVLERSECFLHASVNRYKVHTNYSSN